MTKNDLSDLVSSSYRTNERNHSILYGIGLNFLGLCATLALLANAGFALSPDKIKYDLLAGSYPQKGNYFLGQWRAQNRDFEALKGKVLCESPGKYEPE